MGTKDALQERVTKLVEALGKSPITLARSVGLERGYINDILIGKKKSVRGDKVYDLARALNCDPEYLLETQDVPRLSVLYQVPFGGVVETGVWRSVEAHQDSSSSREFVPIEPDHRYPGMPNLAFEVRGRGFEAEGIVDGMFAIGIAAGPWVEKWRIPAGMIVVVRTTAQAIGAQELSLRLVVPSPEGDRLRARPLDAERAVPDLMRDDAGVEIVAVITRAVRLFLGDQTA